MVFRRKSGETSSWRSVAQLGPLGAFNTGAMESDDEVWGDASLYCHPQHGSMRYAEAEAQQSESPQMQAGEPAKTAVPAPASAKKLTPNG